MSWNYLQVETAGRTLFPTLGPGGLTRAEAHARVRLLLGLHAEAVPHLRDALLDAWDHDPADDTVYAGKYLWAIYEADDAATGAREWVADLARTLTRSGTKVKVSW